LASQESSDITIRVPRSVNDALEVAKAQGCSKKDWFRKAALQMNFLNNDYDFDTSKSIQSDVNVLKNLERVREGLVTKGATSIELFAFDEAIKITKNRLELYRKSGDGATV
jgi:hypothetical protein